MSLMSNDTTVTARSNAVPYSYSILCFRLPGRQNLYLSQIHRIIRAHSSVFKVISIAINAQHQTRSANYRKQLVAGPESA